MKAGLLFSCPVCGNEYESADNPIPCKRIIKYERDNRRREQRQAKNEAELIEACQYALRELGPNSEGQDCWRAFLNLKRIVNKANRRKWRKP